MTDRDGAEARRAATIRVLLADDQQLVRKGFARIIDAQDDMEVVGAAADGRECLELASRLEPDVVIMDIRMPVLDGLEATRRLAGPDTPRPCKVVVATTFDTDEHVRTAIANGASGFILKDSGPALLIEAVRAAAHGDALISPEVTVRYLHRFAAPIADPTPDPLSSREHEIARAVARGLGNREITDELFVSLSTVKTHLESIQRKLGVRNRVEVAVWVLERDR